MNPNTFDIPGHTIIRKIGEGGMGAVYLAVDDMLQRQVAVKVLKSSVAPGEDTALRFQSEAITLAKLRHPNITMLYNLVQTNGHRCMIMEYVEGETLESMLKSRGTLPVKQVLAIAIRTLEGLQHAHSKDVVHRDLKPSNLMLSPEGEVKIMDFGIARIAGGLRLTRVGQAVGTPQYMSPEQVKGQEGNPASDLYSLGIVLYELLTGTTPYTSDSEFEIMQAHTNRKPVPPASLNPDIPGALNNAILKALEKDPSHRFDSADEFKQRLLQIDEQMVAGTPQWQPFSFRWKLPAKIDRQYRIGIGFLAASLLAGGLVLWNPGRKAPESPPDQLTLLNTNPGLEIAPDMDMGSIMQRQFHAEPVAPPQHLPVSLPATPPVSAQPKEKAKTPEQAPKPEPPVQEPQKNTSMSSQETKPAVETSPQPADIPSGKTIEKSVVIPRGTRVDLILDHSYEYNTAPDEARVTLSVAEAIERSGIIIISARAKAYAKLSKNTRKEELELEIFEVESVTGQRLQSLKTSYKAAAFRQGERFKLLLEYNRVN